MTTDTLLAISERPTLDHKHGHNRYGHAAPPGTGPDGETCGTCGHFSRRTVGSRQFAKCGLLTSHQTHGKNADILKTDAACAMWEDITHA